MMIAASVPLGGWSSDEANGVERYSASPDLLREDVMALVGRDTFYLIYAV